MSKDRAGKGLATYSCYLPARLLSNAAVILLSGCRLFFFPPIVPLSYPATDGFDWGLRLLTCHFLSVCWVQRISVLLQCRTQNKSAKNFLLLLLLRGRRPYTARALSLSPSGYFNETVCTSIAQQRIWSLSLFVSILLILEKEEDKRIWSFLLLLFFYIYTTNIYVCPPSSGRKLYVAVPSMFLLTEKTKQKFLFGLGQKSPRVWII